MRRGLNSRTPGRRASMETGFSTKEWSLGKRNQEWQGMKVNNDSAMFCCVGGGGEEEWRRGGEEEGGGREGVLTFTRWGTRRVKYTNVFRWFRVGNLPFLDGFFLEIVAMLLRGCCEAVAKLLRSCCEVVARLLRSCCEVVARLLRGCCEVVARLLRGCWPLTSSFVRSAVILFAYLSDLLSALCTRRGYDRTF